MKKQSIILIDSFSCVESDLSDEGSFFTSSSEKNESLRNRIALITDMYLRCLNTASIILSLFKLLASNRILAIVKKKTRKKR
ncbi:hypothetical protein Glove_309g48 [Diversispora epigaea]|uniref:Uncharacterized protein n=1 Tax=Diversispora epigaea TaxID=1348612 RepID=A0A397HSA0_9GLOM|nr:hypothetical protein Glove_309g48 [Diversispora epigaea]